jgi:PAS domain S-box-containing protein
VAGADQVLEGGLDPDGHYVRVNDAMVEDSGYSRDELLGSHASLVADEETVAESEGYLRELLHSDRDRTRFEATMMFKDGIRREFAASLAVLRADDGELPGTVIVAHDITGLRESKRRLSVLVRVLRHNLRNRMNVILGYAGELADHADDAVAPLGAAIEDNARKLLELSEEPREFAPVITGEAQPTTPVDATEFRRRRRRRNPHRLPRRRRLGQPPRVSTDPGPRDVPPRRRRASGESHRTL